MRKKFSRTQLLRFTSNIEADLIGMEACVGSHFLGKALREQGHQVRLMSAQYIKPFVKANKNDFIDAEAIAEAVIRPTMRFVPIKTDEQLDMQSLHRVRERWITRRTAVVKPDPLLVAGARGHRADGKMSFGRSRAQYPRRQIDSSIGGDALSAHRA